MIVSEKLFDGQAHVVSHADASPFVTGGLRSCFEYRHFGVKDATQGKYDAFVQRAVPGAKRDDGWHYHELEFHLLYILSGWITFEYEDVGFTTLRMDLALSSRQASGIELLSIPTTFQCSRYARQPKSERSP